MDLKSLPACQALREEARILTAYMSEVEASSSLLLLSSSLSLFLFLSLPLSSPLPRCLPPSREREVFLRVGALSCSILRTRVVGAERIPTATNECPPARSSSLAVPRSQPFLPLPSPPPPPPSPPPPPRECHSPLPTSHEPALPTVAPSTTCHTPPFLMYELFLSPWSRSPPRFPRVESDA